MAKQQSSTRVQGRVKTIVPEDYVVVFHNDDVTTYIFVVELLMTVFYKTSDEAVDLTYKIHNEGQAPVGVYSYDIAVTMVKTATAKARAAGYPLLITYEKA